MKKEPNQAPEPTAPSGRGSSLTFGKNTMRLWPLFALMITLSGCRSYTESTPRQYLEGDHASNYRRVFKEEVPRDVTVLNSVVVAYAWRPGVVTTDDFEFELLVPASWLASRQKSLRLQEQFTADIEARKNRPMRSWYAPKPFTSYEPYRDLSSVGYVHMLVDKRVESDGRSHVFFSKH